MLQHGKWSNVGNSNIVIPVRSIIFVVFSNVIVILYIDSQGQSKRTGVEEIASNELEIFAETDSFNESDMVADVISLEHSTVLTPITNAPISTQVPVTVLGTNATGQILLLLFIL